MSIISVNFEKSIKNINNNIYLQINLPTLLNNISYKIYGTKNFTYFGQFKINNGFNVKNILIIPIDKLQNIFILINNNNTSDEYYDFINMKKYKGSCRARNDKGEYDPIKSLKCSRCIVELAKESNKKLNNIKLNITRKKKSNNILGKNLHLFESPISTSSQIITSDQWRDYQHKEDLIQQIQEQSIELKETKIKYNYTSSDIEICKSDDDDDSDDSDDDDSDDSNKDDSDKDDSDKDNSDKDNSDKDDSDKDDSDKI